MLHRPKFAATLDKWLVLVRLRSSDCSNKQATSWLEEKPLGKDGDFYKGEH